jgi:DNA-directed RNA polymerase subunit beta'
MIDFDAIRLKVASPDEILKWSHGEVIKPETINYRTQRPEKDGLFSERIFGPTKDWECYCGKYRRIRYKGVVCDKCGVEVTRAIVRRERMGHIALAAPVAHIWFLRSSPSKISLFLNVSLPKLERVVYYAAYIVTSVNEGRKKEILEELEKEFKTRKKNAKDEGVSVDDLKAAMLDTKKSLERLQLGEIISEAEFHALARRFGDVFEAGIGAEAIRKILEAIDLKELVEEIKKDVVTVKKDPLREARYLRRLKLADSMLKNGMRPEWMIMTMLPVLPPDLRPMVALDGGRYATSDLNDLYRRVINRNNRLKKLLELKAPEVIITNEKRMLQESVDALIDNSARFGSQQLSSQRRPLRSIADMLKGKQGRFRQNLLGKRVDYSGRSVIVIGSDLRLDQCGLPKKMALELFKPFIINKVIEQGLAYNIRNANRLIEQAPPEIWAILEDVITDRTVLLNRAPTLHRLGVQAFKPRLIEDLAIRIPALVCSAFNADFDGDQMAVHVPLSHEAQKEAHEIMLSSLNLLKPATGGPIVAPSQDIVLGCYYLTTVDEDAPGKGLRFTDEREVMLAEFNNVIRTNSLIKVGVGEDMIETSYGRILFNSTLPEGFPFVNKSANKKELSRVMGRVINQYGFEQAVESLNRLQRLGFRYATMSGISWGMDDLATPTAKADIIKDAEHKVGMIQAQFQEGLLTDAERRARVVSVWFEASEKLNKEHVPSTLKEMKSSVYTIIDSGARGSWSQPGQMMGMKGMVQNAQGETIELPTKSSFKEGFSVLEYFISTHGSRKGLTDTALQTATAGYLTRRLVDVAQDLIIRETDCRTKEGIDLIKSDGDAFGQTFASRLFSRVILEDIKDGRKTIAKVGNEVDRETAQQIEDSGIELVKIRSPITCKTLHGLCARCYGYDLGSNKLVDVGAAVGIIAAQSIGEPGTQLTMRTFHIGGVAGVDITHGLPRVEELFEIRPPKGKAFLAEQEGVVTAVEENETSIIIRIASEDHGTKKDYEYSIPRSAEIFFKVGDEVEKGARLSSGNLDLRELFELRGAREVQRYIVNEVQRIYTSEGASINNKHIEVIVRQIFSRVKVKESGDTPFTGGDVLERSMLLEANRKMKKEGGVPGKAEQLIMGISKVALSTESFLSAASFQETARVLINAAVEARIDRLHGLKENVIIGRAIPAGTGIARRAAEKTPEPSVEEVAEDVSVAAEPAEKA